MKLRTWICCGLAVLGSVGYMQMRTVINLLIFRPPNMDDYRHSILTSLVNDNTIEFSQVKSALKNISKAVLSNPQSFDDEYDDDDDDSDVNNPEE